MKKQGAFLTILCLAMFLSSSALAETKTEKAKRLFDEGVAEMEGHNYKTALSAFEKAYKASPHWMVLGLIGNCAAKLARPVEAIEALEQYLEEGGGNIPADERHSARKLLLDERKKVGQLFLVIRFPNAEVKIDGDSIGKAPFERISLKSGVHHIMVVDGDNVMERDVTIMARKEHTVRFPEEKPTPVPVVKPPKPDPKPTTVAEPEDEPDPEPEGFEMDTSSDGPSRSGRSWGVGLTLGTMAAGVITAGFGWGMFGYNNSSAGNYEDIINGAGPSEEAADEWQTYTWGGADGGTCNGGVAVDGEIPVTGEYTSVAQYYCETERSRRDFEQKANTWKIVGIVGSAVAVVSIPMTIIFYKNQQWFVSEDSAKLRLTPIVGTSFSGLSLSGKF